MAEYSLSAEPTHSRWNRALKPRLRVASGDTVHLECVDSSGAQVHPSMTLAEYLKIDRDRIHALTGPIFVEGAEPGDVLQVDVLEVAHKGWGWTSVVSGLGFLKQRFAEPFFFIWKLEGEVSKSIAPAVVPLRPFCGVMGVAPAEDGEFRTRPPGIFGGNMDVRELCTGATLYLPVLNRGALFSAGDAHAAQGDGEVMHQRNRMPCGRDAALPGAQAARASGAHGRNSRGAETGIRCGSGRMDCRRIVERCRGRCSRGHFAHDRFARRSLGHSARFMRTCCAAWR